METENNYSKDFKYTLKGKKGKVLLQCIVTFGTKKLPWPQKWKDDFFAQRALNDFKKKFIEENFDIIIDENLELDN
jgi:mRNA-degrading endonuclease YafQ of YafQ-DinJ toxin-antitoxin module